MSAAPPGRISNLERHPAWSATDPLQRSLDESEVVTGEPFLEKDGRAMQDDFFICLGDAFQGFNPQHEVVVRDLLVNSHLGLIPNPLNGVIPGFSTI
jgi:hypothetical protein